MDMMTAGPLEMVTAVPMAVTVILARTAIPVREAKGKAEQRANSENRQENCILAAVEEELAEQRKRREKAELAEAGRARKTETLVSVALLTT